MTRRLASVAGIAAAWGGVALLAAGQTWLSMMSHGHSPWRLAVYQLCVWWGWAILTAPVLWLSRRFPLLPLRAGNLLVHVAAALGLAVVHGVVWVAAEVFVRPYEPMDAATWSVLPMSLRMRLPIELLVYLGVCAVAHAVETYVRARRLQQSLAAARLHALEVQIQPHFLFNTLNAVSSLVREGQRDEAVALITALSDLLRYSLDHSGAQSVPLERELEVCERYLDIQRTRFPDRMEVRVDVAAAPRRALVPALLLQPLVENAVRHGIAPSSQRGRIAITAARVDDDLRIEILNSGRLGSGPHGIGVGNTIERLSRLYGPRQSFSLRAVPDGVLAAIAIPWSESA